MREGWEYQAHSRHWLYGTCRHGAGVRKAADGGWAVNLVVHGRLDTLEGPFDSEQEAMEAAEEALGVPR